MTRGKLNTPAPLTHALNLSWSVSRGRDTYGYNIRRLDDTVTGRRFRCNGGGYDMTGTVLADWFTSTYPGLAATLADRAAATYTPRDGDTGGYVSHHSRSSDTYDAARDLYGLCAHYSDAGRTKLAKVTLDGACGESSVWSVMRAAGVELLHRNHDRRGNTTGWIVSVPQTHDTPVWGDQ